MLQPAYDVVVAGVGPAGAAAAMTLARGGARVALLDRERFPRDKPCGDLLGRAAVRECLALGLDPLTLDACPVRGVALRAPGGAVVHGLAYRGRRARLEACVIPRLRFDARLLALALEAGASLHHLRVSGLLRGPGGRVRGVTTRRGDAPGPAIEASLVIGADGWGSSVARTLLGQDAARPAQRGIAARCYVEGARGLHGRLRFYCLPDLMPGCAWIFPMGGDRANVGLGTIPPPGVAAGDLKARLERLLAGPSSPAAAILAGARRTGPMRVWPLALGWRATPLAFEGALLAGDAAALISPLSGSGIAAALRSGRLAGEAGLRALAHGDTSLATLRPYELAVRRALRRRYALERAGQALAGVPARLDLLATLAAGLPYGQALAGGLLFNLG